jgi:hypothetical protein
MRNNAAPKRFCDAYSQQENAGLERDFIERL